MALHEFGDAVRVGWSVGLDRFARRLFDPALFEALVDEPPGGFEADLVHLRAEEVAEHMDGLGRGIVDDGTAGGAESLGPALGVHVRPLADGVRCAAGLGGGDGPGSAGGAGLDDAVKDGVRRRFARGHGITVFLGNGSGRDRSPRQRKTSRDRGPESDMLDDVRPVKFQKWNLFRCGR